MVLDGIGGVIINSDGTQLMDLAYDSNGLVIVQQVLTNGTHIRFCDGILRRRGIRTC